MILPRATIGRSRKRAKQTQGSIAPRPATFWNCKPTPLLLAQLPECYGGNGYVEEGLLAAHAKRCTMRHCDRTDSTIVIFA